MRSSLALGLCCAVAACDPIGTAAIAIAPRPEVAVDSARQSALAVVSRVTARHGLEPFVHPQDTLWDQCFGKSSVILCAKMRDREIQFRLWQLYGFSPVADSVRRELLSTLRSQFGETSVRECEWQMARDPRLSGCPPLAERDSG